MTSLKEYLKTSSKFKISVKTNKKETKLTEFDNNKNCFVLEVKAQPIEGRANTEIIKYFKKKNKVNVEIVSGLTSKEKTLRVY
ncbi:hypothetical protein GOV05_03965 [Candidatus Woesearchaeota archaeon]|nr:hypothetical protein [Candidatus Woesearchaeota archaeon]